MLERQPHHSNGLNQVPFQGIAPIVIGAVGDARASSATAHVVDQDVDAAIGRDGGLDQPCRFIRLADIGQMSGNLRAIRAQPRLRFGQLLR